MATIAQVLSWKFPGQQGMTTVDGVITEFPGGIPSQADQDTWTEEYKARDIGAERVERAFTLNDKDRILFEALFEIANRLQALENKASLSRAQLKTWLKNKLP